MNSLYRIEILILLFLIFNAKIHSQDSAFISMNNNNLLIRTEGIAFLGSGITEDDAKILAINDAKRNALEQAGTYLESTTTVLNYKLVKDEIITFTGSILKVKIINESRVLINNMFAYNVSIEALINVDLLNERIMKIKNDNKLKMQLEIERKRNENLEKQLSKLKTSLSSLNKNETKLLINSLTANDWVDKGRNVKDSSLKIEYFSKAINLDSQYEEAYLERAMVYEKLGLFDKAILDYNKLIEIFPKDPFVYITRGIFYYFPLNKYEDAVSDYSKAISLALEYYPSESIRFYLSFAYCMRGYIYNEVLEKYTEAIVDFNNSIAIDPQNSEKAYNGLGDSHFNLGKYYYEIGKNIEAIQEFNYAIGINTHNYYYSEDSKLELIMADLLGKGTIKNLNSDYYYYRGMAHEALKHYSYAINDYSMAIDIFSHYASAHYRRGEIYKILGKNKDAEDDHNKYLELKENHRKGKFLIIR